MVTVPVILKRLFSSKLRLRILSHFFFHPGESFYVRRLASELNEPVGTVGRELANLEQAGIVSFQHVGNQKHFSINKDCPIIEDLRNIFLKTSGAGTELQYALKKMPGVELVFIHGSYVKGDASAASDIDLMIVGKTSDRKLAPAVSRVERRLKREINYSYFTRGEVEKQLGKKGGFIHEVFSGPKIILIGNKDDGLFGPAQ